MINMAHPLVKLAKDFDWERLDHEFGKLYTRDTCRPGLPTRLPVGLHYLKYAYDESDESVVARFMENPYWQYFCGFHYFQHELPLDPTSLVKWRRRLGKGGAEQLLRETLEAAKKRKLLKEGDMKRVNVDTTVQEKAISYPTDSDLYQKARTMLVEEACRRGIRLRQTYKRVGGRAHRRQARYRHARRLKRANRELRRLKTYLGCVIRDIECKCKEPDEKLKEKLDLATRIYTRQRTAKNKLYSLHSPEVECISKGKSHKKYEFGCKVSVVSTLRSNWIVGVDGCHGNPYDGHTLKGALEQAERLSGLRIVEVYVDKGYRGSSREVPAKRVCFCGSLRGLGRALKRRLKRRSAIEPIIGHMKSDNRMGRNYLKGRVGDSLNAIFAGCGFNLRKLIRAFLCFVFRRLKIRLFFSPGALRLPTFSA